MTEGQCVEVIEHAARMTRMADQPKRTLILQARGYSYPAIAGELRVTQAAARKYASRGWRVIGRRTWHDYELQQLQAVANQILAEGESLEAHAAGLLAAAKNSRRVTPVTPTYDENGRQVGGRDGLISIDDVIQLLLGWNGMRRLF